MSWRCAGVSRSARVVGEISFFEAEPRRGVRTPRGGAAASRRTGVWLGSSPRKIFSGHAETRDQLRLRTNDADPGLVCVPRGCEPDGLAAQQDLAGVGLVVAVENS